MGKSWKSNDLDRYDSNPDKFTRAGRYQSAKSNKVLNRENTVWVALNECHIADNVVQHLLARDYGQIEEMRVQFEDGKEMVRVVLRGRVSGGYNVEDGRHRVIAAKLAGMTFIEAIIIGV
jgi:hypothetical protein